MLLPPLTTPTWAEDQQQSVSDKLFISFCPCSKRIAVSVKRNNGEDYKYIFDEEMSTFKPLNCVNCQPKVSETDLFPIYSIFDPTSSQFVTFVHNVITDMFEKYVYNPKTERFEQVDIPELVLDLNRSTMSDMLYTIDTEKEQVVIRKGTHGNIAKERYDKEMQVFVPMAIVEVKTLLRERSNQKNEKSEKEKDRPRLKIRYDFHTNQHVIFVLKSRQLLSVHTYEQLTGRFHMIHSNPSLSETYLYPKCVVFSKSINEHVIHAMNGMTGEMEKFIYSAETQGFEQVQASDADYHPSLDTKSEVILLIRGGSVTETVVISKNYFSGNIMKHRLNPSSLQYEQLPPVEVKFLSTKLDLDDSETNEFQKLKNRNDELSARDSQKSQQEVAESVEKALLEALEFGKVPLDSLQQQLLVETLTSLVIRQTEKFLEKSKTMTVDENLEAEAIDSSDEESSEDGNDNDAEPNEFDEPRVSKQVSFYRQSPMTLETQDPIEGTEEVVENTSEEPNFESDTVEALINVDISPLAPGLNKESQDSDSDKESLIEVDVKNQKSSDGIEPEVGQEEVKSTQNVEYSDIDSDTSSINMTTFDTCDGSDLIE